MWTTKELAEHAGVTDGYIRQKLIAGEIKGEKFGRDWAIPDEEAERWLAERNVDLETEPSPVED